MLAFGSSVTVVLIIVVKKGRRMWPYRDGRTRSPAAWGRRRAQDPSWTSPESRRWTAEVRGRRCYSRRHSSASPEFIYLSDSSPEHDDVHSKATSSGYSPPNAKRLKRAVSKSCSSETKSSERNEKAVTKSCSLETKISERSEKAVTESGSSETKSSERSEKLSHATSGVCREEQNKEKKVDIDSKVEIESENINQDIPATKTTVMLTPEPRKRRFKTKTTNLRRRSGNPWTREKRLDSLQQSNSAQSSTLERSFHFSVSKSSVNASHEAAEGFAKTLDFSFNEIPPYSITEVDTADQVKVNVRLKDPTYEIMEKKHSTNVDIVNPEKLQKPASIADTNEEENFGKNLNVSPSEVKSHELSEAAGEQIKFGGDNEGPDANMTREKQPNLLGCEESDNGDTIPTDSQVGTKREWMSEDTFSSNKLQKPAAIGNAREEEEENGGKNIIEYGENKEGSHTHMPSKKQANLFGFEGNIGGDTSSTHPQVGEDDTSTEKGVPIGPYSADELNSKLMQWVEKGYLIPSPRHGAANVKETGAEAKKRYASLFIEYPQSPHFKYLMFEQVFISRNLYINLLWEEFVILLQDVAAMTVNSSLDDLYAKRVKAVHYHEFLGFDVSVVLARLVVLRRERADNLKKKLETIEQTKPTKPDEERLRAARRTLAKAEYEVKQLEKTAQSYQEWLEEKNSTLNELNDPRGFA